MKGLLLRLSALDADAENAVRVISFFDGLIAAKASPRTLGFSFSAPGGRLRLDLAIMLRHLRGASG